MLFRNGHLDRCRIVQWLGGIGPRLLQSIRHSTCNSGEDPRGADAWGSFQSLCTAGRHSRALINDWARRSRLTGGFPTKTTQSRLVHSRCRVSQCQDRGPDRLPHGRGSEPRRSRDRKGAVVPGIVSESELTSEGVVKSTGSCGLSTTCLVCHWLGTSAIFVFEAQSRASVSVHGIS